MDKKIYMAIGLAIFTGTGLGAQNLNPQVQVTNDYEASMANRKKAALYMQVPDSLTRFDTKVDYSVFDTRYQGAYEFNPYAVTVVPEAREFSGNTLFLKAGAGYSFHPLLQAVYTPKKQGTFRTDVYAGFGGYGGKYNSDFVYGKENPSSFDGHDYSLDAGAEARWNLDKVNIYGNLGYEGILTKDIAVKSGFHEGSLAGRIASASRDVPLFYDLGLRGSMFRDAISGDPNIASLGGGGFTLDATLMPEIASMIDVVVDVDMEGNFYGGDALKGAFSTVFNPRAVFNWKSVQLTAGFTAGLGTKNGIYPDLRVRLNFLDGLFSAYANVGGGQYLNDYASLKKQIHWLNLSFIPESGLGVSADRLDARVGVTGKVFSDLQYDVFLGYAMKDDALLYTVTYPFSTNSSVIYNPFSGIAFADYRQVYAGLGLSWKTDRLELGGNLLYRNSDLATRQSFKENTSWVGVAPFEADFRAVYNWNHRVYAGVNLSGMGRRPWNGGEDKVRGFCLAGLSFEYLVNRRFSLWTNIDNILDQKMTLMPAYIPGGINFTAGLCLRLQ